MLTSQQAVEKGQQMKKEPIIIKAYVRLDVKLLFLNKVSAAEFPVIVGRSLVKCQMVSGIHSKNMLFWLLVV